MKIPCSVLDLAPVGSGGTSTETLRNTVKLAKLAEELGYTRFWLAEHHGMPGIASSSPEVLIATSRRRPNASVSARAVSCCPITPLYGSRRPFTPLKRSIQGGSTSVSAGRRAPTPRHRRPCDHSTQTSSRLSLES